MISALAGRKLTSIFLGPERRRRSGYVRLRARGRHGHDFTDDFLERARFVGLRPALTPFWKGLAYTARLRAEDRTGHRRSPKKPRSEEKLWRVSKLLLYSWFCSAFSGEGGASDIDEVGRGRSPSPRRARIGRRRAVDAAQAASALVQCVGRTAI